MSTIYLPVLKLAVAYAVASGRRWSVLEHMLLAELAREQRAVVELAALANLPARMIVEALIALLRANWIEVRADQSGIRFAATPVGQRRITEGELPIHARRDIRWTSLCFECVTGSWLRSDQLKLVYWDDLPEDPAILDQHYFTYDIADGAVRGLLPLGADETLEPEVPVVRNASRPYARFSFAPGETDLIPARAPLRLRQLLADKALELGFAPAAEEKAEVDDEAVALRDSFVSDDLVVGGPAHLACISAALAEAHSAFVLHSCFVHPKTVQQLLPALEAAARRGVRIELLWGLRRDPEDDANPPPITESEAIVASLPSAVRRNIRFSPRSSGSHAKLLLWDRPDHSWRTVVGSCNWLSTWYDAHDMSILSRSQGLAALLMSWMLETQLPSVGGWSGQARRLNQLLNRTREAARAPETGEHRIKLIVDDDHFACIRMARDYAETDIVLGCDLFGNAAETSTLVPMERAAELGRNVKIYFQRPTKWLRDAGLMPTAESLATRGMKLAKVDELHGKFLAWDEKDFVVSSFNWLSTTPDTRVRGAEFGLLVQGAAFRATLRAKLGHEVRDLAGAPLDL